MWSLGGKAKIDLECTPCVTREACPNSDVQQSWGLRPSAVLALGSAVLTPTSPPGMGA